MTAPIQPGNSGGPRLDRNGEVVGVVVAKLDAVKVMRETGDVPQNVNFAVSLGTLRAFLDASSIDYVARGTPSPLSVADIGTDARPSVARVECLSRD
jgi:S1-C subfamily serine protease